MTDTWFLMVMTHIILALAWIVYCILHSVFASVWFKNKAAHWMGAKYKFYRLFYSLFAAIGFFIIIFFQLYTDSKKFFAPGIILQLAGWLLFVSGLTIMMLYVFNTGLRWLVKQEGGSRLIQNGIHRHVRHPLYSGTFLLIWGLWILLPSVSLLIMNVIITVYTLVAIRFEEEKLIEEFGEDYLIYKKKTPGIIPRIRFFKS